MSSPVRENEKKDMHGCALMKNIFIQREYLVWIYLDLVKIKHEVRDK